MAPGAHYHLQLQRIYHGKDLIKSCELGIKYVNEAIKSNLNLGKGNGPINHLNSFTINKNLNNEKCSSSRFTMGR